MANNPKVYEPLDLAQSEQNNLTAIADIERKRILLIRKKTWRFYPKVKL